VTKDHLVHHLLNRRLLLREVIAVIMVALHTEIVVTSTARTEIVVTSTARTGIVVTLIGHTEVVVTSIARIGIVVILIGHTEIVRTVMITTARIEVVVIMTAEDLVRDHVHLLGGLVADVAEVILDQGHLYSDAVAATDAMIPLTHDTMTTTAVVGDPVVDAAVLIHQEVFALTPP